MVDIAVIQRVKIILRLQILLFYLLFISLGNSIYLDDGFLFLYRPENLDLSYKIDVDFG